MSDTYAMSTGELVNTALGNLVDLERLTPALKAEPLWRIAIDQMRVAHKRLEKAGTP